MEIHLSKEADGGRGGDLFFRGGGDEEHNTVIMETYNDVLRLTK